MDDDNRLEPPSPDEVRSLYDAIDVIYARQDKWHHISRDWIQRFITENLVAMSDLACLNLGSGGNSYGLPESAVTHIDIHSRHFLAGQRYVIADIQNLVSVGSAYDACLCVGSVLNHCDAAAVIASIGRTVRIGGTVILEFESSASLELLFSPAFLKPATVIDTFYYNRRVRVWAYSESYIRSLLYATGFRILKRSTCHHLSPLAYLVTRSSSLAASAHLLDPLVRLVPGLNRFASNVIYACRKDS